MENYRLNERYQSSFFLKSSRTLYIGNLKENITDVTLYKYFGEFGDIISINIEKEDYIGDRPLKVYAFIKYFDTNNAIHAVLKMNGVNIEGCDAHVGFAKLHPTRYVWITGINGYEDSNCLLTYLADCGTILTCSIDHINKRALVYFKEIADASAAINKIKNGYMNGLFYIYGDYASPQCQIKFSEFFNKQHHKKNLSMSLDNADIQNTTISNVNKQKLAESIASQITCIWVNGIADSVTNEYLESYFNQFGPIHKCLIDRFNKCALLCFQEELHAQLAVTAMNGRCIQDKSVYVRLASLRCQACDVSYRNYDNVTIQQQDNTAQSSLYSALPVDPSCKCTIYDENYPINISDPRYNKTSQHKYLNTYNINIPIYCSKTNHTNNSSITIIFNEYPPERLKPPTQYADSDILSLPLPEFAKNISKELTSTSSRYLLSSSTFGNQDTCTFNVNHDEMINYGFGKTDNQNENQDRNNNHSLKSNYKILESAVELQNSFFEKSKRLQDDSDEHTFEQFIQSQSSLKFKDQQLCSSLSTFSNSSKCSLDLSTMKMPMPEDADKNKTILEIDNKFPDDYPKHWATTSNWLSDTIVKENDGQKKLQIKQQFLDGFVAKNSVEPVKKPTIIDEQKMDNDIKEHNIANILLSLNTNYKNRIMQNETKNNVSKTNCNQFAGSISNNEKKNEDCKPKIILNSKSKEPTFSKCKQFEFDMCKIKKTINKKKEFLINSETNNKDCKFDKEPTIIEEEKHNLNILKNYKNSRKDYKYKKNEDKYQNYSCFKFDINDDNKSKKYTKKVDGNITSSYSSTENSLKRSVSNPYENHNDSKRWKTDNKIYTNNSTKTSKHHSVLSKLSKNIHNNRMPENKNMSQLDKTPNQRRIRGWINGHSIFEIISNKPKMSILNKVKD